MDDAKTQLTDKLKTANNILVTVSRDPSVDQLSALLGLTLLLNKQGKHTAAVFSGEVPSTLEFLQPEDTIEKNTDSLRDFIIALDKSKADKLRYKVEDNVVRIFITPYRTSISEADFEFSQGDFNVDLVIALGVKQQEDLDEAITAHGRILHDATVASINTSADGGLGAINWHAPQASSLSELVTDLAAALGDNLLDEQIATALLTGIVAETDRFRNEKTTSQTMSMSAALMAAGANQQVVASKLEVPEVEVKTETGDESKASDGALEIEHDKEEESEPEIELPAPEIEPETPEETPVTSEETPEETPAAPEPGGLSEGSKLVTEPPTLGGTLTANSSQPELDPVTDPLSLPNEEPPQLLERKEETFQPAPTGDATQAPESAPQGAAPLTPPPPAWTPPADPGTPAPVGNSTLSEIEEAVHSPHAAGDDTSAASDDSDDKAVQEEEAAEKLEDAARTEINDALNSAEANGAVTPEPIQALNAQPLGGDLHPSATSAPQNPPAPPTSNPQPAQVIDSNAPPPVPPPIPFQFGNPPQSQ